MRKRVYLVASIIGSVSLMFNACGNKEESKKNTNESVYSTEVSERKEDKYEFKEMSEISPFSVNQIVKYTNEYTDAKLYEWSDDIVLPFPMPNVETTEVSIGSYGIEISGVDENIWKEYCRDICEKYHVITSDGYTLEYEGKSIEDKTITSFYVIDMEQNYKAFVNYVSAASGISDKDYIEVLVQFGNQENSSKLSNEQVLEKVFDKLEINEEKREGFYVYDVTSHSNIDAGFDVYYVQIPSESGLEYENENKKLVQPTSALCVVKDEKIVFLEYDYLYYEAGFTFNNEVEFKNVDETWEMYVLRYSKNDPKYNLKGGQVVDRYVLQDDVFQLEKEYSVKEDLKIVEDATAIVTFEKNGEDIEFYQVSEDFTVPYWKHYKLGDKLGVLKFENN